MFRRFYEIFRLQDTAKNSKAARTHCATQLLNMWYAHEYRIYIKNAIYTMTPFIILYLQALMLRIPFISCLNTQKFVFVYLTKRFLIFFNMHLHLCAWLRESAIVSNLELTSKRKKEKKNALQNSIVSQLVTNATL